VTKRQSDTGKLLSRVLCRMSNLDRSACGDIAAAVSALQLRSRQEFRSVGFFWLFPRLGFNANRRTRSTPSAPAVGSTSALAIERPL